jgi:hypothetical protein
MVVEIKKILVEEIKAQANLKNSYQLARVFIIPEVDNLPPKVGLEVKLVPLSQQEDEEKIKPKSIYFVKEEISKLDMLINSLIAARWTFFLKYFKIEPENVQLSVDYFVAKIKEKILNVVREYAKSRLLS